MKTLPLQRHAKPSSVRRKREPIKVFKDGREVLQGHAGMLIYRQRTEQMARRQNMICCRCKDPNNPMSLAQGFDFSATFDHLGKDGKGGGRGMGGSRRDDRIVDENGAWLNSASHYVCNGKAGSRRE